MFRAGEMARRLSALAALQEDPGLILAPTWQATTVCNSRPRESSDLFWPLRELHAHAMQLYMQAKQPHTQSKAKQKPNSKLTCLPYKLSFKVEGTKEGL